MASTLDLYAVFGLDERADFSEITRAYRSLAKRYHPDLSQNPETSRQFVRVVKAYKILKTRATKLPKFGTSGSTEPQFGDDLFALGLALSSETDALKRCAAAKSLGLSGMRSAYIFLRKALYDRDERVVAQAVRSISLLGIRQAEGEIASLYARASRKLRDAILETARSTRESVFASTLKVVMADSGECVETRRMADRTLKDMGC